jgi:putative transposase
VKYAFVREHRDRFTIALMCEVFGVSRSGYHDWLKRLPSARDQENTRLRTAILRIYQSSRRTYGSPRVHAELVKEGFKCSRTRVERLMKELGISAKTKRKFKVTTDSRHNHPISPNLVNRDFKPVGPDRLWLSDITYIPTEEGWLYLATVMDAYSRKIVGWCLDDRMTQNLVLKALDMAVERRKPGPGLIHHSDRGSQYAAKAYQRRLWRYRMKGSMSRKGDCWDNSPMESFFHTLKTELVYFETYKTREQGKSSVFEYIEVFYNRQRSHSGLGFVSPECYEQKMLVKFG